jgi:hypothetical protein
MEDDGRALFFTVTNVAETDAGRRAIDEWAFQTTPLDYDPATASATFDRGTVLLTHDYFGEKVWDQMGRNEQQRALSKCAVSPEVFLSETSRQKVVAASHAQASMVVGTVRAAASERRDGSACRAAAYLGLGLDSRRDGGSARDGRRHDWGGDGRRYALPRR